MIPINGPARAKSNNDFKLRGDDLMGVIAPVSPN